jgi:hypothetical protein
MTTYEVTQLAKTLALPMEWDGFWPQTRAAFIQAAVAMLAAKETAERLDLLAKVTAR